MSGTQTHGIWLMIAAVFSFAVQDGFSRHLAETYNTLMVVMIRYWVFAAFVVFLALRRPEGLTAIRSKRLHWHVLRAVLLVAEICVMVYAYTLIGLIQSLAIFTVCPLFVVAMSGPILGERLSLKRWIAVGLGCVGVLVILRPGAGGVHLGGAVAARLGLHVRALFCADKADHAGGAVFSRRSSGRRLWGWCCQPWWGCRIGRRWPRWIGSI